MLNNANIRKHRACHASRTAFQDKLGQATAMDPTSSRYKTLDSTVALNKSKKHLNLVVPEPATLAIDRRVSCTRTLEV